MRQTSVTRVKKWQRDQHSENKNGENASGVAHPFAHTEAESRDHHHPGNQCDRSAHQQERARRNPFTARPDRVCDVGGSDKRDLRYLHRGVEPHVPRHQESNPVAERETSPLVKSTLQRHQAVEMRHHQSLRNEEQKNRKQPQDNMGTPRLDRGTEELGDDHDQNLCQHQIGQA